MSRFGSDFGGISGDTPTSTPPAAPSPAVAAAALHPAVAAAAASHPAVAAIIASHPAVQLAAPHVAAVAARAPTAPVASLVTHPAVVEAARSHPAVAAIIGTHPLVREAHRPYNPNVHYDSERFAGAAHRNGWSWPWSGARGVSSLHWPWHGWGRTHQEAGHFARRRGLWGHRYWPWNWFSSDNAPDDMPYAGSGSAYVSDDPGLPSPAYQDASYRAVEDYGNFDTTDSPDEDPNSGPSD